MPKQEVPRSLLVVIAYQMQIVPIRERVKYRRELPKERIKLWLDLLLEVWAPVWHRHRSIRMLDRLS